MAEPEWEVEIDRPHRSVSQLLSWANCGEQFRLERIAKAPQLPAGWFVQGHATHVAIEEWEKNGRETTIPDLEELYMVTYEDEADALVEKWPDEDHWLTGGRKKGFDDLSERQDRGWLQVLGYLDWARSQDHLWEVIDVERLFIQHFGVVPVKGAIDQIVQYKDEAGTLEVRDLKSGTKTPASIIQLAVYAHVVERVLGKPVESGAWVKLLNPNGRSEAAKATQLLTHTFENEPAHDLEFLEQMFRDADRAIDAELFVPNPSDGCERVCGVSQWCRAKGFLSSAKQYPEGLLPLTVV